MNAIRSLWLSQVLQDPRTGEGYRKVAETMAEAVTGTAPASGTDWQRLMLRTGLPRQDVFDAIEDLIDGGYIGPWRNGTGYSLLLPMEAEEPA